MTEVMIEDASNLRVLAEQSHAWPFEEARKIVARLKKHPKDEVIFETGYGPSGLPHIGTFGEVARTTMVRHAFRVLTDDKIKTRLIAFSDDMDGLRKVPDNIPNKEMVAQHLTKPLTEVPDPFGTHGSFGEHNNARLRAFLDQFGFDYEFLSSTACYTSGRFDAALLTVLAHFEQVMAIMLPSLREERAQSYSPFLPISPRTRSVLQVPVLAHDAKAGTITYEDPDTHEQVTTLVTGGRCKLQWKPDWAMRWVALGVDYEMAGKDLIDSVKLSGEICRALGGTQPEGFNYELFLDENGQKISKSKGNGLTIDEWLRYASPESLSLFMYREPKAAKRLYFDVIPRHVDEYYQFLDAYERQAPRERLSNPVWHIHSGAPPKIDNPVPFAMLLSLVTASNAENADTLWGFIGRYRPGVTRASHPHLAKLVDYAIHYFRDFVLPAKKFREPSDAERAVLIDLRDALSQVRPDADAQAIQEVVYEVGRREPFLDHKKKAKDGKPGVSLDWFNMLYQVLLGQGKGPRFGSFVAAYGIQNTIDMIDGALARSQLSNSISPPGSYREANPMTKDAGEAIEKNIVLLFDSAELLAAKSFYGPAIHLMMAAREESVKWIVVWCWEYLDKALRGKIFRHDFKHENAGIFYFLGGALQARDFAIGALELLKEKENDPKVREAVSAVIKHLPTVLRDSPEDLAKVITTSLYSMPDASEEIRLKGKEELQKSIDSSEKLRLNSIYVDFDQALKIQNEPQKLQKHEYDKIKSDVILAKFHIDKLAGRSPDKSKLYSLFPDWKADLDKSLADLKDRLQKETK